jgi:hypothetical protein
MDNYEQDLLRRATALRIDTQLRIRPFAEMVAEARVLAGELRELMSKGRSPVR